ncbi:MAG: FAD-dependent oxidoreductase, partial [Gammaproteobacteria bacterium]|nr:FAD-dependent oxidoreductase [Gammaproteobacteria bacterium]
MSLNKEGHGASMTKSNMNMARIIVVGGGFAGLWASVAASRKLAAQEGKKATVTLISRDDYLTVRPRLYEAKPQGLRVPLESVLRPADVLFREATVVALNPSTRSITLDDNRSDRIEIAYDRLVLATGSELRSLPVPGIAEHAFNIDTFAAAVALDVHLAELGQRPAGAGDDTVVILGAGFTGIELASEMRNRLAVHWGQARAAAAQVLLVERAGVIGAELGVNPRPYIEAALLEQRVQVRLNALLDRVEPDAVWLASGERIKTNTTIVTAGLCASPLAKAVPGAKLDDLGRLHVNSALQVDGVPGIYAAGDIARAYVDDEHLALMSCQHAITFFNPPKSKVSLAKFRKPTCFRLQ